MPDHLNPRSAKKRRLESGRELASPLSPSLNRGRQYAHVPAVPPTPLYSPHTAAGQSNASRRNSDTGNINTSADPLAHQIFQLYNELDNLQDALTTSYDAERKARKEAHEATQKQLTGMQEILTRIARDYALERRRERMGVVELGLFGEALISPKKVAYYDNINNNNSGFSAPHDEDEDVDVEDANMEDVVVEDSQPPFGVAESTQTLRGGMPQEERTEESTEEDSQPVIHSRKRRQARQRQISKTLSPGLPLENEIESHMESGNDEAETETYSFRELKRSLELGTRKKKKRINYRVMPIPDSQTTDTSRLPRSQPDTMSGQEFSQVVVPPNLEDAADETYTESPFTTPERETAPGRVGRIHDNEEEFDSQLPPKRPQRKSAQVVDYYDLNRYLINGEYSTGPLTPERNGTGRGFNNRLSNSPRQTKKISAGSRSPTDFDNLRGGRTGASGRKHRNRMSEELGDSIDEAIYQNYAEKVSSR